jgi:hypothetical protein
LCNEVEKNAFALIPVETVTEFVFGAASTITIPVGQQPALDELIEPAEYLQSITVDYALCRDIDGKDRLKVQRATARYIDPSRTTCDAYSRDADLSLKQYKTPTTSSTQKSQHRVRMVATVPDSSMYVETVSNSRIRGATRRKRRN